MHRAVARRRRRNLFCISSQFSIDGFSDETPNLPSFSPSISTRFKSGEWEKQDRNSPSYIPLHQTAKKDTVTGTESAFLFCIEKTSRP
jgi:hypothetical protein